MFNHSATASDLMHHWNIWLVTVTLIVAAVIDGMKLKVPNWLTLPMIVSGWIFNFAVGGWAGLGWSMVGMAVGLALLLPANIIGGMGEGDVKLLAGVGAWVLPETTFYAFCWSAVIGGVIAVAMILWRGGWRKHRDQFLMIYSEIMTIGNPSELSAIAAERKSSMLLLPYGIPIAIGTIAYFAWTGMLGLL
ncbi:MAG TPA: prepilin peptidase [Pirellulales bacterium]|jgi:prepilin peptidase CpaA|nr:prepilin peptidase [Pirellulales bacterium]